MTHIYTNDLYVVTMGGEWSETSLLNDVVYTDKLEAEKVRDDAKTNFPSLFYEVVTLDSYIQEARNDARSEGRQQERDSRGCD